MLTMIEVLKAILFGVVEGITEWLPISSTGHMILLDKFVKLKVSPEFLDLFLVVIQLGAILAVVVIYWNKLIPLSTNHGLHISRRKCKMWVKIIVASIPAGVVGILWDDVFTKYFYNYQTVAAMLIIFGVLFIVIENYNKKRKPVMNSIAEISWKAAVGVGLFQLIAAVFPGTSRSGATILGAMLIGCSRTVAAEFTFFLAIPIMFGWGLVKCLKFFAAGLAMTMTEVVVLAVGIVTAFVMSVIAIKFLMGYIKKNDFTAFGWYRIVVGVLVLGYFVFESMGMLP